MRISAKARYALASVISMAENRGQDECITIISLSEKLKISKIYLEQVFALLKRGDIVTSIKGAQGGYRLVRPSRDITVYDILSSIETSLFENTEETVAESDENIEKAMRETVFDIIDSSLKEVLMKITLEDMLNKAEQYRNSDNYMYYL